MTEIFIDPSKPNISLNVMPQSLHVLGFEIVVFDNDGNSILERYEGQTSKGSVTIDLKNQSVYYKSKYIRGVFGVESPDGSDYNYKFVVSIALDTVNVAPAITMTGTTSGGEDTCISTFHLN